MGFKVDSVLPSVPGTRDKSQLWPTRIFVAQEAQNDALSRRITERLPDVPVTLLEESADPVSQLKMLPQLSTEIEQFGAGKRWLLLTRHKGSWLKSCPGTSGHVCCNLMIVNPGAGCPMDCTYCYLQSYLRRSPTLKLYTNTEEMIDEIKRRALAEPKRLFRVGTGELIDSLVWDELTDLSLDLVPFFAQMPNLILELKTKDNGISNLLKLRDLHGGKTVVSWSVNAEEVCARDEAKTATLQERIEAAELVAEAGYRVGLHFDPLVHFEGWEEGYRETISRLFARLKPESIAWVSLSSLRYRAEMQEIMMSRFPQSKLAFGEQFLAKDDKLRYIQPLRFKMIDFVWKELKSISESLPIYLCMESPAAWRTITGGPPVAGAEVSEVFARSASKVARLSSAAISCKEASKERATKLQILGQTV